MTTTNVWAVPSLNTQKIGNSLRSSWRDISIALAGILQAATQVEQLAKTGYLKTDEFETAVKSLFETNPDNSLDVFGGDIVALRTGLEKLEEMLTQYKRAPSTDIFRYALGVMHIQKRLTRKKDVLAIISDRLDRAQVQSEHFGFTHDNLIRNIADIYSDTISKFQYRIQVTGNYNYLQQDRVANQVRTLLLGGIRAATLWRQLGGSRWQFVFYRKDILNACHELVKEAKRASMSGAA